MWYCLPVVFISLTNDVKDLPWILALFSSGDKRVEVPKGVPWNRSRFSVALHLSTRQDLKLTRREEVEKVAAKWKTTKEVKDFKMFEHW